MKSEGWFSTQSAVRPPSGGDLTQGSRRELQVVDLHHEASAAPVSRFVGSSLADVVESSDGVLAVDRFLLRDVTEHGDAESAIEVVGHAPTPRSLTSWVVRRWVMASYVASISTFITHGRDLEVVDPTDVDAAVLVSLVVCPVGQPLLP